MAPDDRFFHALKPRGALAGGPWPAVLARVAAMAALAWLLVSFDLPDDIEARSAAVAGIGAGFAGWLLASRFARRRWPDQFGR